MLTNLRDITLDDILFKKRCNDTDTILFLQKNTDVSVGLVWQISSPKEMFLI